MVGGRGASTSAGVVAAMLTGLAHLCVWWGRAAHVPDPYMDEIFHVPQTQRYCRGDFQYWDPKITTFPGLYLASAVPHWLAASVQVDSGFLCSTLGLRLINGAVFGTLCAWLSFKVVSKLHGATCSDWQAALNALVITSFPVHFFSADLFYTDAGSLAMILLSFLLCLHKRHHWSAATAVAAVLFRQTNVVWAAFVLAFDVHSQLNPGEGSKKKGRGVNNGVSSIPEALVSNLALALTHRWKLLKHHFIMISLLLGFVLFVRTNGGIVVGDAEAHRLSLHLVQFFYCALVISASYSLSASLSFLGGRRSHGKKKKKQLAIELFWAAVGLSIIAVVIKRFTLVHPYILADNRHYTFYVWSKVLGKSERVRLLLALPYFIALRRMHACLSAAQTQLVVLAYFVCMAATVVFAELLEFRYFILPFAMYGTLAKPLPIPQALATLLAFNSVNLALEVIFLYRPFTWPDGSIARFMW